MEVFRETDAAELACILAEPEVARCLTVNTSTPERSLQYATSRIEWHNANWQNGYGVWAVREAVGWNGGTGRLLGWCGFAEPVVGNAPEILYALAPAFWRRRLGREITGAAISWLIENTRHQGVSATIFGRLNPASVQLARSLGMERVEPVDIGTFMEDIELAQDVLEYEFWRLREGRADDYLKLLFQAPYRIGQLSWLDPRDPKTLEHSLVEVATTRGQSSAIDQQEFQRRILEAFRLGLDEAYLDRYYLARADWNPQ